MILAGVEAYESWQTQHSNEENLADLFSRVYGAMRAQDIILAESSLEGGR